jgi:mannose-6-phosphate isomerase-like protein (cupin superfamily)
MNDFVVERWDLDPFPGDQAPAHVHHESDEAFGVVSGQIEVRIGDQRRTLTAGDLVVVPAGTVHTFATVGTTPVRMYCVMTPQIDSLIRALHEATTDEERTAVWTRHASALAPE